MSDKEISINIDELDYIDIVGEKCIKTKDIVEEIFKELKKDKVYYNNKPVTKEQLLEEMNKFAFTFPKNLGYGNISSDEEKKRKEFAKLIINILKEKGIQINDEEKALPILIDINNYSLKNSKGYFDNNPKLNINYEGFKFLNQVQSTEREAFIKEITALNKFIKEKASLKENEKYNDEAIFNILSVLDFVEPQNKLEALKIISTIYKNLSTLDPTTTKGYFISNHTLVSRFSSLLDAEFLTDIEKINLSSPSQSKGNIAEGIDDLESALSKEETESQVQEMKENELYKDVKNPKDKSNTPSPAEVKKTTRNALCRLALEKISKIGRRRR